MTVRCLSVLPWKKDSLLSQTLTTLKIPQWATHSTAIACPAWGHASSALVSSLGAVVKMPSSHPRSRLNRSRAPPTCLSQWHHFYPPCQALWLIPPACLRCSNIRSNAPPARLLLVWWNNLNHLRYHIPLPPLGLHHFREEITIQRPHHTIHCSYNSAPTQPWRPNQPPLQDR